MPRRPEDLVAALPAITLAEVRSRAALERRVDRKYVVPWTTVEALVDGVRGTHAVLEIDGRRSFGYRTEYHDSADLLTYRAHVQRRRRRFKVRVREYLDTGERRLELKTKGRRGETVKRWTDEPIALHEFARAALAEAYGRPLDEPLAATVVTTYRRITLVALADAERVTIDYDLGFTDADGTAAGLLAGYAVVESKAERRAASADLLLRRLGARPVRVSKYVLGTALLTGRVPNDLRPLARRCFAAATRS